MDEEIKIRDTDANMSVESLNALKNQQKKGEDRLQENIVRET